MTATREREALRALDARRRQRRGSRKDVWDRLANVTTSLIFGLILSAAIQTGFHPAEVRPGVASWVTAHAASVLGGALLMVIVEAVRLGSRGGPLLLDQPSVEHVLLAPISRMSALRKSFVRLFTLSGIVAIVAGLLIGSYVAPLLPGAVVAWVAFGALALLAATALAIATSLTVAARTFSRRTMALAVAALAILTTFDIVRRTRISPLTWFGSLAISPLGATLVALIVPVAAVALLAVAIRRARAIPLEAMSSRGARVREMRFAVAEVDLLSWFIVRRHAQGSPRTKPWFTLGRRPKDPIFRRSLHSVARWRAERVFRMSTLVVLIMAFAYGAWLGSLPALIGGTLVLAWIGIESADPFAEAIEKDDFFYSLPQEQGRLEAKHLVVQFFVSGLLLAPGALFLVWLRDGNDVITTVITWAAASMAGPLAAAFFLGRRPGLQTSAISNAAPPEASFVVTMQRFLAPLFLPLFALMSIFVLHRNVLMFARGAQSAQLLSVIALALAVGCYAYLASRRVTRRAASKSWLRFVIEPEER